MTLLVATRPNLNLRVKEVDGTPNVPGVSVVVVPNGSLTNDGGGQVTLTIASGVTDHALLSNLDYASAAHTGFAGTGVANTFTAAQTINTQLKLPTAWDGTTFPTITGIQFLSGTAAVEMGIQRIGRAMYYLARSGVGWHEFRIGNVLKARIGESAFELGTGLSFSVNQAKITGEWNGTAPVTTGIQFLSGAGVLADEMGIQRIGRRMYYLARQGGGSPSFHEFRAGNVVVAQIGDTTNQFAQKTIIGGTTPAAQLHVDQSSTTGAIPVLLLDQADLSEEFIRFTSTVGAGNPIDTAALGAYYGKVRVYIEGVGAKWLALYD